MPFTAGNTGTGLGCRHHCHLNNELQERCYLHFIAGKTETPTVLPKGLPASKTLGGSRIWVLAFLTWNPVPVPSLHVTVLDVVKGLTRCLGPGSRAAVAVGVWGLHGAHSTCMYRVPTVAGPVCGRGLGPGSPPPHLNLLAELSLMPQEWSARQHARVMLQTWTSNAASCRQWEAFSELFCNPLWKTWWSTGRREASSPKRREARGNAETEHESSTTRTCLYDLDLAL